MSISRKYGRSFHYSFSEGTTSDDRINWEWKTDVKAFSTLVHTEKLDGEGSCISQLGVFARSHAAPTTHPWADYLKIKQSHIKNDLASADLEIFGENLYAIHSIVYPNIDQHFFVFGVRCLDKWLSWEETKWYAEFFDLQMVPEIELQNTTDVERIEARVKELGIQSSVFDSLDSESLQPCTREGIVSRNIESYDVQNFCHNLFKMVRKNHVKTADTAHWSKNIKRAMLRQEREAMK